MPIKYFILTQFHLCLQHFQKVSSKLCHTSPQHLPCNINIIFLLVLCTSYLQNADLLSTNLAPELISIQASNKNNTDCSCSQKPTSFLSAKCMSYQNHKTHKFTNYMLIVYISQFCGVTVRDVVIMVMFSALYTTFVL